MNCNIGSESMNFSSTGKKSCEFLGIVKFHDGQKKEADKSASFVEVPSGFEPL